MTDTVQETLYCVNHPQVETALRCNKCGNPICTRCAVRTPVGYRCRNCLRTQQQIFETALWYDYLVAVLVSAPIGLLSSLLLPNFGFFMLFLAPVAGGLTAEIVRAAVRRRRGQRLPLAATAAFALGASLRILGPLFIALLAALQGDGNWFRFAFSALWPAIYVVLAASTLYARLRGIAI
jgi:hypothetical protein